MRADRKQDFNIIGPKHLAGTSIDWNNEHHRRIIMASLVNGVYTLKCDQKENRQGRNALAPPWWEHFHFEKTKDLHDPKSNNSIFGAIFKFKFPNHISLSGTKPPKYVIAFRGTSLKCCKIKGIARGCRSIVIAAAVTLKGCYEDDSEFNQLSTWTPNIFVNSMNRICKVYIGYFEHREKMDKYGLGRTERVATQHSVRCLIPGAKPSHLLPVARLTNKGQREKAHALQQWWVPQQQISCESKIYNKFWPENSGENGECSNPNI